MILHEGAACILFENQFYYMQILKIKRVTLVACMLLLLAYPALADTLSSTNYQVEDATTDGGGGLSNSTNYQSVDAIGDTSDSGSSSSNYKSLLGFLWPAHPGIPGTPTLTNTGGTLYNTLDFVIATGNNSTDTVYAIAISSDNFTTTNYIQIDDTIASTEAWQTYANWGSGTGERVVNLQQNTAYKIKVKARHGIDTDTGFSATASATTSQSSLTISFAGVTTATVVAGETTTITSTANAIAYGSLVVGTPAVAAHTITVTTNATSGYTTTLQEDHDLQTSSNKTISPVSGSNASPGAWPGAVSTGAFGYHTTDSVLCSGSTNRFSSNNTYAAATTSPLEVACASAPATTDATTVVYKLQVGGSQSAGSYQNTLTYITTAQY